MEMRYKYCITQQKAYVYIGLTLEHDLHWLWKNMGVRGTVNFQINLCIKLPKQYSPTFFNYKIHVYYSVEEPQCVKLSRKQWDCTTLASFFLSFLSSPVSQRTTVLWHNLWSCWLTAALSGRCISSLLCFSLVFPSLSDLPFPWKSSLSPSRPTHPLNPSSLKSHSWIRCQACRFSSVCSGCLACGNCNVLLHYVIVWKWLKQTSQRFVQAHSGAYMNKPRHNTQTHAHPNTHTRTHT